MSKDFINLLKDARSTTKKNEKIDIIKKYISKDGNNEVGLLLNYACNPFLKFNISNFKVDSIGEEELRKIIEHARQFAQVDAS